MFGRRRLACSFCGKGAVDVAKLVAGPKVYICDECVAVASRIMKGDGRINPPLTRIVAVSWKGCVPGSVHLSSAAEFSAQRVSRLRPERQR